MLDAGPDAVAAGLAGDQQRVGAVQPCQQRPVHRSAGVCRVGHLGLQRAVVLGPGVVALDDAGHRLQLGVLPGVAGCSQVGVQAMAPAADLAMHRPDLQAIAAAGFERVEVGLGARQLGAVTRRVSARAKLGGADRRERRHRRARAAAPERRVRDVDPVVRVQRDGDRRQRRNVGAHKSRQPQHVGMRTGHSQRRRQALSAHRVDRAVAFGQVAEIVLRVDDQQFGAVGHGLVLRAGLPM